MLHLLGVITHSRISHFWNLDCILERCKDTETTKAQVQCTSRFARKPAGPFLCETSNWTQSLPMWNSTIMRSCFTLIAILIPVKQAATNSPCGSSPRCSSNIVGRWGIGKSVSVVRAVSRAFISREVESVKTIKFCLQVCVDAFGSSASPAKIRVHASAICC